jgi:uncharacterized membrane protein
MTEINWIHVGVRWIHVVAAIVAVGGALFIRAILMPAAARAVPEEARDAFREAVRKRWAVFYSVMIVLLLASGLFNYLVVTLPMHRGQASYNAMIGVKIILALAVFFIGSALVGRAKAFEALRRSPRGWLSFNIFLALLVVALGCALKFIPPAAVS